MLRPTAVSIGVESRHAANHRLNFSHDNNSAPNEAADPAKGWWVTGGGRAQSSNSTQHKLGKALIIFAINLGDGRGCVCAHAHQISERQTERARGTCANLKLCRTAHKSRHQFELTASPNYELPPVIHKGVASDTKSGAERKTPLVQGVGRSVHLIFIMRISRAVFWRFPAAHESRAGSISD